MIFLLIIILQTTKFEKTIVDFPIPHQSIQGYHIEKEAIKIQILQISTQIKLLRLTRNKKKDIDDPNFASKDTALQVPTRGQKVSGDQKT